jgi:hypothetical protein
LLLLKATKSGIKTIDNHSSAQTNTVIKVSKKLMREARRNKLIQRSSTSQKKAPQQTNQRRPFENK